MRDPVQLGVLLVGIVLIGVWWTNLPDTTSQPVDEPVAGERTRDEAPGRAAVPANPGEEFPASVAARPAQGAPRIPERSFALENDDLRVRVSNQNGRLESLELIDFADRLGADAGSVQLVTDRENGTLVIATRDELLPDGTVARRPLELVANTSRSITFQGTHQGLYQRRELSLDESGFGGKLRVILENRGEQSVRPDLSLIFYGVERERGAPDYFQNYQLTAESDGGLERRIVRGIGSPGFFSRLFGGGGSPKTVSLPGRIDWAGIESQYFLVAALPDAPDQFTVEQIPTGADSGATRLIYSGLELPGGTRVEREFSLYFGPKIESEIVAVDDALLPAVNVGWNWVRPIVVLFARALRWSHDNVVANYGVSIILLTVLLRLLTFPLTQKSMKSMKRFGEIAPMMKELQEKHGENREKLQQEMMKLYKDRGVNPFSALGGGCLPMLIQMPFMIALYFALQGSIELRHAPFALWIQDLSAPEDFFSIAGFPIRPLPLLMGGSMILQQRLGPQTGDPQQRQMMMWMSVVFTFMFYTFPSGLLLYWFVSNVLGIGQQFVVNRDAKAS